MLRRRLLLSLFCWAALATATATVEAAAPKAVLRGPETLPAGGTLVLDARASVSDKPLVWKVEGPDLVLVPTDSGGRQGVVAFAFNVPANRYRVILVAKGAPSVGADLDADVAVLDVVVGGVQPIPPKPPGPDNPVDPNVPPKPPGPPNPGPVPGFDAQANGQVWAKELVNTFADSLTQAGRDIMDGKSMDQAKKDHVARWAKTRDDAFNARFVGALDQLVPPNVPNPSIEQRRRYWEFIQSLTQGSKEAVH